MSSSYIPVPLAHNIFEPSQGRKNDTPIIFIHGIFACKEYWVDIPQIVADATHRTAYAVDLRNHGDSEWSEEFSIDLNVVDLLNFMDQIKARKAILVGHSMGGITTMKAALKEPSRIEKIVVEDMTARTINQEILGFINLYVSTADSTLMNIPPGTAPKEAMALIAESVLKALPADAKPITSNQEMDSCIFMKRLPDGTLRFKGNTQVLRREMMKTSLALEPSGVYEGSACFIYGEKSPFLVNQDESIKKYFPKAQLVCIKDALHGVHSECPKAFTDALLKFLKE